MAKILFFFRETNRKTPTPKGTLMQNTKLIKRKEVYTLVFLYSSNSESETQNAEQASRNRIIPAPTPRMTAADTFDG
jgi:hypothetical protein